MSGRWFRFYADAMRKPKVARLSDKDFRLWVELLAIASEGDGKIPPLDDLKHLLRRRLDHLSTGVDRLISARLIDELAYGYEPHGWNKYQYKSDTSTDRVKKYRDKRNVSETPPEAETDTETDTEEEDKSSSLPTSEKAKPVKRALKLSPDWMPTFTPASQSVVDEWPPGKLQRELQRFRDHAADKGRTSKDWQAAFRTWITKADEWMKNDRSNGNQSKPPRDNRDGFTREIDRQLGLDPAG